MIKQRLHSNWTMRDAMGTEWLPATVPGSVYGDQLANSKMEDPFWRDNELDALALMERDYVYQCGFDAGKALLECDEVYLRCEGLDTVAELTLNGRSIGRADNMHRTWEFDVKRLLKEGGNELSILFRSPTRYIKERHALNPAGGSSDAMVGFPQIRKAHCMFGWDWGPRLPDAGIWRDIMLCGITSGRIDRAYIVQKHRDGKVELDIDCDVTVFEDRGLSLQCVLTDPGGNRREYGEPDRIVIEEPKLWWPNGYGEQPLYKLDVILSDKNGEVDRWTERIGLRTMTTVVEDDEHGRSFTHAVNGVKLFAMGADYIPEDNLLGRVTPARTRKLLEQCKAANFNCVRVWGGGYYPDNWFFDACDELGLIVWQDFMFSCAVYNLDDEFERNIRAEFRDNIIRLANHASLGLFCGNNEMEMFVDTWQYDCTPRQKADYIKMYEYIIPKMVEQYAPQVFYWPASPSSGGSFDRPNDPNLGDVHYWDVWHGGKPFSEYRKFHFRYASEFGFQSFPALKTVESFTLPEDRNIFSYIMEKHQRNDAANGLIMKYMSQTFLYPTSFATVLYASQLLQAEAIKYGVEHWRRNRGRCMGAIYWQLNDCWPVASWASIDYYGRWKALHYFAKRFFAPVLLSCQEEGVMTQNTNANREVVAVEQSIRLSVANETREDREVTVRWALRDNRAKVKEQGSHTLTVPALTSVWLEKVEFPEADLFTDYVSYELEMDGARISSGSVLFHLPKHFRFVDPRLSYVVSGDEITVRADAYARSVEIRNDNEDLVLSDNYFDMNAGTYTVKVLEGDVGSLWLRSVYDIK